MIYADAVIVGAGAAGLAAACHIGKAAKGKRKICILEHKDAPGKKILATGNGRCNFANDIIDGESFRGNSPEFAYNLVKEYNKEWLLSWLKEIGIAHTEINGYYYPMSKEAASVARALISKAAEYGAHIALSAHADGIKKEGKNFVISAGGEEYMAKYAVLACGGRAQPALGSDGSGYALAKKMGHLVSDTFPSLMGLAAAGLPFKACAGIRAAAKIKLYGDGRFILENRGEVQFTDYGISGIPVFQISRYAARLLKDGKKVRACLDFAERYSFGELYALLKGISEANPDRNLCDVLNGIIPYKLAKALAAKCGNKTSGLEAACRVVKSLDLDIKSFMPFEKAQVTAGGVYTGEVDNETMESRICEGLYITGEMLDIDGNCGGYNLHFAFATGACAGNDIGGKL